MAVIAITSVAAAAVISCVIRGGIRGRFVSLARRIFGTPERSTSQRPLDSHRVSPLTQSPPRISAVFIHEHHSQGSESPTSPSLLVISPVRRTPPAQQPEECLETVKQLSRALRRIPIQSSSDEDVSEAP
jgi:hypothetical protein